jgi:hypothetical protein
VELLVVQQGMKEKKGHVTLWPCHLHSLPFKLKTDLKAKEELWKLKYILPCKKCNLQKIL